MSRLSTRERNLLNTLSEERWQELKKLWFLQYVVKEFNRAVEQQIPEFIYSDHGRVKWQEGGIARFVRVIPPEKQIRWSKWYEWRAVFEMVAPDPCPVEEYAVITRLDEFHLPSTLQALVCRLVGHDPERFGHAAIVGYHIPTIAQEEMMRRTQEGTASFFQRLDESSFAPIESWPFPDDKGFAKATQQYDDPPEDQKQHQPDDESSHQVA